MSVQSNAVAQNDVSAVIGYMITKGYFNAVTPNLPQNISILGEANTANQSGLILTPTVITNAVQAANLCGYGSPVHAVARILFNAGVSVPVTVYPQLAAGASVAKVITITPSGTATGSGTIYLCIAGREQVDGQAYAVNIVSGDTVTIQCNKMRAAVAAVLGCPMIGSGTTTAILTAAWTGLTSNDLNVVVDLQATSNGVTYAIVNTTAGSGTPSIGSGTGGTTGLDFFNNAWNTTVINTYGLVSAIMASLEAYNGVPDPVTPTGQYAGIVMRPMFALSGTCLDSPISITTARSTQVTIVACPAPLSLGMPYEAAANACALWAPCAQNTPHLDILDQTYPDMPGPAAGSYPQMMQYAFRQQCVTNGCSTVDFSGANGTPGSGLYTVKDFVTTYNVSGEFPPFYQYVRTLNIHFNYKFGYRLLQVQKCVGKALVTDSSVVTATDIIKPKIWSAAVAAYNTGCEARALLVNTAVNNATISSSINATNPNRMDTTQAIQISGYDRINSTTTAGGFAN